MAELVIHLIQEHVNKEILVLCFLLQVSDFLSFTCKGTTFLYAFV